VPDIIARNRGTVAAFAAVTIALALLSLVVSGYTMSFLYLMFANVALSTAWSFFSGATRYISLATSAFYGIGVYALAISHLYVPIALALVLAAIIGFLVAVVVGLSTLRLRGVYFVIFTFGLTELMHQVINWWEIKINRTATRYIFSDVSNTTIYLILLVVAVVTVVGSWYVSQSRLGYALRAIGEDETVARHTGINTTWVKVLCFALSSSAMALVGAVLVLRFPYIDAPTAFNSSWSFQVLIAALLGGPGRYWGPMIGAIPLVLLSEVLAGTRYFSIILGLCFIVIVYFIPGGLAPLIERYWHRLRDTVRAKVATA
jgi:branched-chain amino acid transport system permease protein